MEMEVEVEEEEWDDAPAAGSRNGHVTTSLEVYKLVVHDQTASRETISIAKGTPIGTSLLS